MNTSEDYVFLSHCVQHLVAACLTKDHDAVERAKRKLKDSNIASRIKDSLVLDDAIVLFNDANLYFMNESNDENDLERGFRMLAFQAMKDAMGSETVLLSDFCTMNKIIYTICIFILQVNGFYYRCFIGCEFGSRKSITRSN